MIKARLISIANRACRLYERLEAIHNQLEVTGAPESDADTSSLEKEWIRIVADGDPTVFNKRLMKLLTQPAQLSQLLANEIQISFRSLPSWGHTLEEVIKIADTTSWAKIKIGIFDDEEIPVFAEVLWPFAVWALKQLYQTYPPASKLLSKAAERDLFQNLLKQLSWLSARVFALNLNVARVLGKLQGETPESRYYYFVTYVLKGSEGLLQTFDEYPALARLLATVTENWTQAQVEMLSRLEDDQVTLSNVFDTKSVGCISRIDLSLSDSHAGYKTVCKLRFISGLEVIYKPRSTQSESVFQDLLKWCNQARISPDFKTLKIISRDNYGWIEYIQPKPCNSIDEIKRYYYRQGMNLCLTFVLGATDLHFENIIACGEYPVLVDLETLFHPEMKESPNDSGPDNFMINSVLRTGLLPSFSFGDFGIAGFDNSGLGGKPEQITPIRQRTWINYGTDEMKLVLKHLRTATSATHLPQYGSEYHFPENYVEEVVSGFEQMYEFLVKRKNQLIEGQSPLSKFMHCQVRCVVRSTEVYFELLSLSLDPRWMRQGVQREILLESLWRNRLERPEEVLVQSEVDDLWSADIPFFYTSPESTVIWDSKSRCIQGLLEQPSFSRVINRMRNLNESDCSNQTKLIRTSLLVKFGETKQKTLEKDFMITSSEVTKVRLLDTALEIGTSIARDAIHHKSGISWIGLEFHIGAQHYHLTSIGYDLYNGTLGIALFLGHLSTITGDRQFRELTYATINPSLKIWTQTSKFERGLRKGLVPLGGFTGIGGAIYTFSTLSSVLEDESLCNIALDLALLLNDRIISSDNNYDVISGSAGCLLALLHLFRHTKNKSVLERAKLCGLHLVRCQVRCNIGAAWHQKWAPHPLTGMGHGTAGIAYALVELAVITGDRIYLEAAEKAIAFERSTFSQVKGNWPDFRCLSKDQNIVDTNNLDYMVAWCHGATGIGCARLEILPKLKDATTANEVEIAAATTISNLSTCRDHLCCGLTGQVDFLFQAGLELNRDELLRQAYRIAYASIEGMNRQGHWSLGPKLNAPVPIPGLMQGLAGIGLTLLRLAYPDQTCRVLLLK